MPKCPNPQLRIAKLLSRHFGSKSYSVWDRPELNQIWVGITLKYWKFGIKAQEKKLFKVPYENLILADCLLLAHFM